MIVLIVAAIISSADWPHDAKLVPLTACGMALVAAVLNLVYELFGPQQAVVAHANSGLTLSAQKVSAHVNDLGVTDDVARWRAISFFAWMAAFIGLIALIGFIPAIAVFVFAYMSFGFGEPRLHSLGLCLGDYASVLGRLSVGPASRVAAIAARRSFPGVARIYPADLSLQYCNAAAAFFTTSGGV